MQPGFKKAVRVLAIGATLAVAPVAYSPATGVQENALSCQNGTCCREDNSICGLSGNTFHHYYYKSEGSCVPKIAPDTPG
jgi:hypothetical protein